MNIDQLNQQHAIEGQVVFVEGKGGLPMIQVATDKAKALVSVYAGQVLSFKPEGQDELLFVSDAAYFEQGKAIKGGIPICWPWFGDDPDNKGRGAHGFVRNRQWRVSTTGITEDGDVRIELSMIDTGDTRSIWAHEFDLTLEIVISDSLALALISRNPDTIAYPLTQAMHTYFKVGNINDVSVTGLENRKYLDKAGGWSEEMQTGAISIKEEVDRVYLDVPSQLKIHDPSLSRKIVIRSHGNKTAVVWNPWKEIAAQMGDLDNDDYEKFLCVETTNAASDVIDMAPGSEYFLSVEYQIIPD